MKVQFRIVIILLYILSTSISIAGQFKNINFRRISPIGGFSLKEISSIKQDNLGYIWMGTKQGLVRYDSNNTKWFIPSANDSLSISNENINDIHSDTNNHLWVSTNNGICKFNADKQNFTRLTYKYENGQSPNDTINGAISLLNGSLYIIDNLYFGILNKENSKLIRIAKNQIKNPVKICSDNSNKIWIATKQGNIYSYNSATSLVSKIISVEYKINNIYAYNNNIWVGTDGNGALQYDTKGKFINQIIVNNNNDNNLGNVRVIKKDTYGHLWLGAYEGLFMHNGERLVHFKQDDYNGLPHSSIFEIFEDKQGGIWVGTWSGGIAYAHHADNKFKTFQHTMSINSISDNTVSSFIQLNKNELLVGTEGGGLNTFNIKTEQFSTVNFTDNYKHTNIKSICKDKYGGIWIGTFRNGLFYKAKHSNKFKVFTKGDEDGRHISSSSVYSLCPVDSGIWIGTLNQGINFYNFKSKSVSFCFKANNKLFIGMELQTMLVDSNSNLWLGTLNDFLYKIHIPNKRISKISPNISNKYANSSIYCIYESNDGNIWIGTKNNGIVAYNPNSEAFQTLSMNGILHNKDVYGIIKDKFNRIWISSNNGLVLYTPDNGSIRHFVHSDGIQGDLFCPQSIFKDLDDKLYFGGTNGFTIIEPSQIKINNKEPNTIINRLTTHANRIIYPDYNFDNTINKISLTPYDGTFKINFSADNYLLPDKNNYKYRLINHNNNWIDNGNTGSVLFNNIKPGEYVFEVKACNNDGIWKMTPTKLNIIIKNYWYKSSIAIVLYLILFILISYFIAHFYLERINLKQTIIQEIKQRENEEQLNEMKLNFFTNVSHEFKTPLTLITWPLKRLLNAGNLNNDQREELEMIRSNSNRLLQLINQIIDFRSLDDNANKLNLSRFNLLDLLNEMQKYYSVEAKAGNIDFVINAASNEILIEADREKIDSVIFNLLSNAFKFTSDKGKISVSVSTSKSGLSNTHNNQLSLGEINTDNFIEISVEDNGCGIEKENVLKIFNRFEKGKGYFNLKNKNNKCSGIGLSICKEFILLHHGKIIVNSKAGIGSKFTLQLPTKQDAQIMMFESHQKVQNLTKSNQSNFKEIKKESHLPKSTILVVEDNNDMRKLITKFLNQYYDVINTSDGNEAISILGERTVDLIVSDIMMPNIDGLELCRLVKSKIETSHIPIVLLTALSSSDNILSGLDNGADAYLSKPLDENILIKQIENILEQRDRIRKKFSKSFLNDKNVNESDIENLFLKRVKNAVEKNINDESFSMEILAQQLMISRSQLHRKIKSLSGMTSTDFVNLIKIKKSIELIEETNCLISEVAFKSGFNSQSYYSKCFKKVYNMTPKEYFENQKTNITNIS